jgi:hypothetical protein
MSHELDILLFVSGGGSSGQIATRGISSETTLNALSNACTHKYILLYAPGELQMEPQAEGCLYLCWGAI